MRIHTIMPKELHAYFRRELECYRELYSQGKLITAWKHLERAHILGQRYPFPHSYVHWKMLMFGIKIKSTREILGQIPRFIFGGVKSFVGSVPIGNPGGSNVPPLKPYPLSEELLAIFIKANVSIDRS